MGCLNYVSTLTQRLYKIIFKELKEEDSCLFLIYKDLEGFYYVINHFYVKSIDNFIFIILKFGPYLILSLLLRPLLREFRHKKYILIKSINRTVMP